jgi:hypothetical protein
MPTELRRADRRTPLAHCHGREEVLRGSVATIGAPCVRRSTATDAVRLGTKFCFEGSDLGAEASDLVVQLLDLFLVAIYFLAPLLLSA